MERFGLILVVGLLLFQLAVRGPTSRSRQLIHRQTTLTGQATGQLGQVEAIISGLPPLEQVKSQQPGSVKAYADEVATAARQLQTLKGLTLKAPVASRGLALSSDSQVISDTNKTLRQVRRLQPADTGPLLQAAGRLFSYHRQVMTALVNLLEYDPQADMAGFMLGSDDTTHRLDLARQGLAKSQQQLAALPAYSDPSLADVDNAISSLRGSLDQLAQNGDTSAWISAVSNSQAAIIKNRAQFWQGARSDLLAQIHDQQAKVEQDNRLWWQLASKYQVN